MSSQRGAIAGGGLVHQEITQQIIGAFFDVYNELGSGFLESVYQRALQLALSARGVESQREVPLTVYFRGEPVGDYRADLIVEGKVIVESKAAEKIVPVHQMQLANYLKATGLQVGFVMNFGPRASFRRIVMSSPKLPSAFISRSSR